MKKATFTTRLLSIAAAALLAALLSACGDSAPDPHDLPRDAKPWESVDPSALSQPELLARLQLLARETAGSVARSEFVEYHHLEAAMTGTLDALEPAAQSDPEAAAAIASLKKLVEQLHVAGHDMNATMANKLAPKIAELSEKILAELGHTGAGA